MDRARQRISNEKLNDRNWNVRVNCEVQWIAMHVSWIFMIMQNEFRNVELLFYEFKGEL